MENAIEIVKIGGGIIEDSMLMDEFLDNFSSIANQKILIHGGGKGANEMLTKLGISPKMQDGRRITDAETLEVVVQLYAGLFNKKIVAALQTKGNHAIGLSGADGHLIESKLRDKSNFDFGFVGDPLENGVNTELLSLLLDNNYTPVCCAISMDKEGQLLNTNADTIASVIATSLAKTKEVSLTYCFDKIGVLKDINDDNSLIKSINYKEYKILLKSGIINDGMKPKLDNAFMVIKNGVTSVRLCHANNINNLIGTLIKSSV